MPTLPHFRSAALMAYGPVLIAPVLIAPVLIALALSLAGAWWGSGAGRGKSVRATGGWASLAGAAACLFGWAALVPLARLQHAALSPRSGPELLLAPAAVALAVQALLAWRGGRNPRLIALATAGFTGWWLARAVAGPSEFWRVGILVAASCGVVAWLTARQPVRELACALALWGGLAVAGLPLGWTIAAAVMAAAWAGPLLCGTEASIPPALLAAVIAGADLTSGRALRGRVGAADVVCVLALVAPLVAGALQARMGKGWGRFAPASATALGAGFVVALGWVLAARF